MTHSYEIEIKSLLGTKERAQKLKEELRTRRPDLVLVGAHKQLNHYFNTPASLEAFERSLPPYLLPKEHERFKKIVHGGKSLSVRTREAGGKAILVIKASIDEGTSANAVSRMEFEAEVREKSIEGLDRLLLEAGFTYQAKWSREREEYKGAGLSVMIDKNAGYGYLAEFEKVVHDESETEKSKDELAQLMRELDVTELSQERLERMFAYYNEHWPEYYGTEKTFIIE